MLHLTVVTPERAFLEEECASVTLPGRVGELQVLPAPEYVGFWSYLRQRYVVEIQQKSDKTVLGTLVVDCNYGAANEKKPAYSRVRDPKKFKVKECKITKIIPATFQALPVGANCSSLSINL